VVLNSKVDEYRPAKWRELSKEQQCVLFSAAEESLLIGVLANWEPDLDWPGRVRHVPRLAAAALTLVRAGLIQVYEQHLGAAGTRFLTESEALLLLSDAKNWWRDEEAGEHPDVAAAIYALVPTDSGRDVLLTRGDDELYGFLRH
jgi:hypothetical protein